MNENIISFFFSDFKNNSELGIDKVSIQIIQWLPEDINGATNEQDVFYFQKAPLVELDSVTKYFSKEDIEFVKKQIPSLNNNKYWNRKNMEEFTLLDSIGLNIIVKNSISKRKKKHVNNYAYFFSKPLFSKKFDKVIIKQQFYCGFLCATECIYIYEKQENGLWKKISNWSCWSS